MPVRFQPFLERELLVSLEIFGQTIASEKAVKTHVSNILSKLYVQDRTQAAIYALHQRLVPLEFAIYSWVNSSQFPNR